MGNDGVGLSTDRTRTGSAWLAVGVLLVLVLFMLIFVLQNGHRVSFEFLWVDFTLPVGVALLLAAVVGGLLVVLFGAARVVQLRLAARRHRRVHEAPRQPDGDGPVAS